MSKFGALLAGFGTGLATGEKMRLERERAGREAKAADLDMQVKQNAIDKDRAIQDAYREISAEAVRRSGVQIPEGPDTGEPGVPPRQASPQEALGFALHQAPDLMRDRDFLNKAASTFLAKGLPDGIKWLEAGHAAAQEGYTKALQALMNGDAAEAAKAFNASGKLKVKADGITPVEGEPGKWQITSEDGKTGTLDPKAAYLNLLPPKDFAEFQMKAPYYKALADYQGGRNEANVTRAEVGAEARVEAAGIGADSRVEAAGIRADGTRDAAATRAARGGVGVRAPGGTGTRPAATTSPYGGDKGAAKWTDDFEKHYMPKRDVKTDEGTTKVDPKTGSPFQEVDQDLAPTVRSMARINSEVLATGGVHPQEAANVFTEFAKASKIGNREKMFDSLDTNGRIAIAEDDKGNPIKAVGIMGQYRDARGQVRPMFFELPEKMSDELVAAEAQRRVAKDKAYPDETKRGAVRNAGSAAAAAARRGVANPAAAMPGMGIPAP